MQKKYYSSMEHCNLKVIYVLIYQITKGALIIDFFSSNLVWAPKPYTIFNFVWEQPSLNLLVCLNNCSVKLCQIWTRHIQNPVIVGTVYSGIIQRYSGIFRTLCNACICRNLAYLEFWNIQNPSIIASWGIFRTLSYLQK